MQNKQNLSCKSFGLHTLNIFLHHRDMPEKLIMRMSLETSIPNCNFIKPTLNNYENCIAHFITKTC